MLKTAFVTASLLTFVGLSAIADEPKCEAGKCENGKCPVDTAVLGPFKQLAGEWVGRATEGPHKGTEMRVRYKLTAGGSAVVETLSPGEPHEMVSIIHPDGNALVLTHYCMLGNQPTMRTAGKPEGKRVAFDFASATNLPSASGPHMHSAAFTFVDANHLKTEWTMYQDGKLGATMVFELERKK